MEAGRFLYESAENIRVLFTHTSVVGHYINVDSIDLSISLLSQSETVQQPSFF
jgi:hypothetical protein